MENPKESPAVTSTTNCRHIGCIVMFCGLGLCIVFGVIWFSLNPRVSSPEFQISSFSVSPFNSRSPSSLFDANWKIAFLVRNPTDSDRISYDQFEVALLYHGVSILSASVSPFYQRKGDEGLVEVSMAALSDLSVDNNVVSNIYEDLKDGAVNFTVAGHVTVRVKYGFRRGRRHHMKVSCDNVMVGFCGNNGGALVGGSARCGAHIKLKFWEPL
ncbi:NDR1/HIN1-like protein 10 [Rhododendron vialii]|uniref:NDR1/HIN1-like protein 10 n=1 Tax=Rhododendron vialii TaxID=182163 RepID=UPI00266049A5|nr:NDR1/HIN1-like protein 10 [Rhododendron vialii]